jgi:tetratricopeptide (TPR) repeat protein
MRALIRTALPVIALAIAPRIGGQSDSRLPDLLATGDQAWASQRFDDALRSYSEVLRRDSSSTRALFRVATLLSWRNDFNESIALFRKYLTIVPADPDGRVALARVLAWDRAYASAIATCDSVLVANPENRDAALLAAQTIAWSGHFDSAAARYKQWLARHPSDAEAWNELAQLWRWSGRSEREREALRNALASEPTNATALARMPWTEVALSPSVEPGITSTDDTDRNRTVTYLVRAGLAAPWSARVHTDLSFRSADLGLAHGTSATARASSSWASIDGSWTIRGDVGVAQLGGDDGGATRTSHTEPLVGTHLSGRVSSRLSLGVGVEHAPFDETAALIFSGIATTTTDADAEIRLQPRLSLGTAAAWTRFSGGSSPNTRVDGSGALRWSATPAISIAAGLRTFAYDHAAFDGYFAPKRYILAEGSARLHLGGELGWGLDSELGLGHQRIIAFDDSASGRFAQRFSIAAAFRPTPGVEWSLGGSFANAASPTTISSADYRAYSISLKGRLRL